MSWTGEISEPRIHTSTHIHEKHTRTHLNIDHLRIQNFVLADMNNFVNIWYKKSAMYIVALCEILFSFEKEKITRDAQCEDLRICTRAKRLIFRRDFIAVNMHLLFYFKFYLLNIEYLLRSLIARCSDKARRFSTEQFKRMTMYKRDVCI